MIKFLLKQVLKHEDNYSLTFVGITVVETRFLNLPTVGSMSSVKKQNIHIITHLSHLYIYLHISILLYPQYFESVSAEYQEG